MPAALAGFGKSRRGKDFYCGSLLVVQNLFSCPFFIG
jgi:hypothetical protein